MKLACVPCTRSLVSYYVSQQAVRTTEKTRSCNMAKEPRRIGAEHHGFLAGRRVGERCW